MTFEQRRKIQLLEDTRDQFLKDHPELQQLQDQIMKGLSRMEDKTPEERCMMITMYMLASVNQLLDNIHPLIDNIDKLKKILDNS